MSEAGRIIACIWDFDGTLISGCMQSQMFLEYGIDEQLFWESVDQLELNLRKSGIRLSHTLSYLNYILKLISLGYLPELSKKKLVQYGKVLRFFPGLPDFFSILKEDVEYNEYYRENGLKLEHYIVSNGHAEIISGSQIAAFVDGIFASEFLDEEIEEEVMNFLEKNAKALGKPYLEKESVTNYCDKHENLATSREVLCKNKKDREVSQVAYAMDDTLKTRCLFEISKGCNKNMAISVNQKGESKNRRIPFRNMIYIADGISDIPSFSVMRDQGGKAFAVYDPCHGEEFEKSNRLFDEGRVNAYGPADYCLESSTAQWIRARVQEIAQEICVGCDQSSNQQINDPIELLH
jgi:hypothetical protein